MPRSKRTLSLARLFDQCPDPIYVMDAQRRIVYANPALVDWIGLAKEDVVGLVVEYHAHDDQGQHSVTTGLCPPPTAFAGRPDAGQVSCSRPDGQLVYRRGQFLPLGFSGAEESESESPPRKQEGEQRCVGVVAFLEPRDLPAAEQEEGRRGDATWRDLHRAIGELRRRRNIRGAGAALVGNSAAMQRARRQVELAASARSPLLVVGSDAWQRRRVAEFIPSGKQSSRDEAVIPFDSTLVDENLLAWSLESIADRGRDPVTLLFHDVHELPAAAQVFLAERIGRWPPQWRVIATSASVTDDADSPPMLDARLFHWLSTLVIDLPPLAARLEDLPLVIQYCVEEANISSEKQIAGFSPAALDRMQLFDWPGGLTQVREVVAASHARARGPEVVPADLPPLLAHVESAAAFPPERTEPIPLEELLASMETTLIRRALELADGNKTQAAALLGMTRPRLYRRMEQLGLE